MRKSECTSHAGCNLSCLPCGDLSRVTPQQPQLAFDVKRPSRQTHFGEKPMAGLPKGFEESKVGQKTNGAHTGGHYHVPALLWTLEIYFPAPKTCNQDAENLIVELKPKPLPKT